MAAAKSQAHELRTPLAVILVLAASTVQVMLGRSEKAFLYGEPVREYGQLLSGIVDRATLASAIDSVGNGLILAMLDGSRAARDALEEVRSLIEGFGSKAESALAEGFPAARADAEALQPCVGEMLNHSVKSGLPGCLVRIAICEAPAGLARGVLILRSATGPAAPAVAAGRGNGDGPCRTERGSCEPDLAGAGGRRSWFLVTRKPRGGSLE